MDVATKSALLKKNPTYFLWVGVFFLILTLVVGLLYYATQKIDYVWRWYRIPQYFVFYDDVEIRAEIEGTV